MDLVFYWHAFKHWWWVLLLTVAATVAGVFYFENQRGKPWQAESEINIMGPYALTPLGLHRLEVRLRAPHA